MSKSIRWVILGTIIILVVAALGILQACNRSGGDDSKGEPQTGGMTEVASEPSVAPATEAAAGPTPYLFNKGESYSADAELIVYASPSSTSSVLEVYAPGATFTILEPNGDFVDYPVVSGGVAWVRIRAADGLAGWAKADAFGD